MDEQSAPPRAKSRPNSAAAAAAAAAAAPSTAATGTVRARSPEPPQEGRPPTKRARKAINCEPCRNSKLKCDRNRPCSSCVLRGTTSSCYKDGLPDLGPHELPRCDPAAELSKVRQSLNLLESYIFPNIPTPSSARRGSHIHLKREPLDDFASAAGRDSIPPPVKLPGLRSGGLYQGPTSAAMHLVSAAERSDSDDHSSRRGSQERDGLDGLDDSQPSDYDRDLLACLPPLETIDGLISFYFESCNWIYRHVHQPSFAGHWSRYKNGSTADHLILSTACAIMAIASRYLPFNHHLLDGLNDTHEGIGNRFYDISTQALQRRQAETKAYNLELVELLLIRSHYLTMLKSDSEEIWHIRGELCTIGMAMGLHRDPGKWRMPRELAERRRWAWWHIILFERWQAFMFGRPLAIAAHHYDTQLPSYCDPALDKTGRLYLPNLALFQLAHILADVIDDAVSVRQVPYESVQANDRALTRWMESLPTELDLDEYRVARSLASADIATRRAGVQSVIIRTSYYHIRFTLHRPYAAVAHSLNSPQAKTLGVNQPQAAQSLETAVNAADKLITMVGQARPDFLANSALAVPGHMNWGPFHVFSAAMFFSFQLISNPDQPGAGLFRQSIKKAMATLDLARGTALAEKAIDILQTLSPLYSPEFIRTPKDTRERQQTQILSSVRTLAFPYHDSRNPRQFADSPSTRGMGSGPGSGSSPANSSSMSPPMGALPHPQPPQHQQHASQQSQFDQQRRGTYTDTPPSVISPLGLMGPQTSPPSVVSPAGAGVGTSQQGMYHQFGMPQGYAGHGDPINRFAGYGQSMDDSAVWGASVGINIGEWTNFIDGIKLDPVVPQRQLPV